jgi:hypothetical protein
LPKMGNFGICEMTYRVLLLVYCLCIYCNVGLCTTIMYHLTLHAQFPCLGEGICGNSIESVIACYQLAALHLKLMGHLDPLTNL